MNVCPERSPISCKNAKRGKNDVRTVETHEGVERPVLGIVVVVMTVRPAEREGLEMSSIPRFNSVDSNEDSPLIPVKKRRLSVHRGAKGRGWRGGR